VPNAQVITVQCPRCVAEFQAGLRDEDRIGELVYQRVRLAPHERVGTGTRWGTKWGAEPAAGGWPGDCSLAHHDLTGDEWLAADAAAQREVNDEDL